VFEKKKPVQFLPLHNPTQMKKEHSSESVQTAVTEENNECRESNQEELPQTNRYKEFQAKR
jgi:hypothetical protein